ncbi:MAG: hypothetical protein HY922_16155 [Elusimicrobia bacterium]|nr:hypothetical protein [Elusimicrobiota bacterium]
MGKKSFFKVISNTADERLRFQIATRKGRITESLIQLELYLNGAWQPVARCDNSHGFAHRDVLDPDGNEVEKSALKLETFEQVLEYGEQDLRDRADWYAGKYLRMRASR